MVGYRLSEEIKDAIKALSHETRVEIIEYLRNNEILYPSKIQNLNLTDNFGELENHLEALSKSGLINRYTTRLDDKDVEASFYKLSPFAIKLINGMGLTVEPIEYVYGPYGPPASYAESVRTYHVTKIKTGHKPKEKLDSGIFKRKLEEQTFGLDVEIKKQLDFEHPVGVSIRVK
jgi:DNA-binding transcriptional ArsR family regulator